MQSKISWMSNKRGTNYRKYAKIAERDIIFTCYHCPIHSMEPEGCNTSIYVLQLQNLQFHSQNYVSCMDKSFLFVGWAIILDEDRYSGVRRRKYISSSTKMRLNLALSNKLNECSGEDENVKRKLLKKI